MAPLRMDVSYSHLLLLIVMTSHVNCGSFYRLQQKLTQQNRDGNFEYNFIVDDVKQWVSKTIDRFSHQVEFLGDEIERAVNQKTFLEHDKFFSDGAMDAADISDLQRESPPYEVLCASADGYEARQYYKALWVITFSEPGEDYSAAKIRSYTKIKEYILGNNRRGIKIHITSPWLTQVIRSSGDERDQYAFFFFLPATFQDDPPTPTDPTIFFEYMNLRVFAFSFGYGVGGDANIILQEEVIQLLGQNEENVFTSEYYISDYEAPFSENSKNNEILIPLNESESNGPYCDAIPPPVMQPSTPEEHSLVLVNGENSNELAVEILAINDVQENLIYPRAEMTPTSTYLRREVTGCSPDSVDAAIVELFSNLRMSQPENILNEIPWYILLRVTSTTCSGSSPIELFFQVPDTFQELTLPESLMINTSLITLPTSLNYIADFELFDSDAVLLETAFVTYSRLKQKISGAGLCNEEAIFYIRSNLQSGSSGVNQVWVPYSNDCWDDTREESDSSGDDDIFDLYVNRQ